jgi:hypothetical protein
VNIVSFSEIWLDFVNRTSLSLSVCYLTTLYACPKKKPATCDSIPKLKIDWDKVDKEEYKKNVKVELEDFRYLKMKTPYGVEQDPAFFHR